jgi:localization factor PodJL
MTSMAWGRGSDDEDAGRGGRSWRPAGRVRPQPASARSAPVRETASRTLRRPAEDDARSTLDDIADTLSRLTGDAPDRRSPPPRRGAEPARAAASPARYDSLLYALDGIDESLKQWSTGRPRGDDRAHLLDRSLDRGLDRGRAGGRQDDLEAAIAEISAHQSRLSGDRPAARGREQDRPDSRERFDSRERPDPRDREDGARHDMAAFERQFRDLAERIETLRDVSRPNDALTRELKAELADLRRLVERPGAADRDEAVFRDLNTKLDDLSRRDTGHRAIDGLARELKSELSDLRRLVERPGAADRDDAAFRDLAAKLDDLSRRDTGHRAIDSLARELKSELSDLRHYLDRRQPTERDAMELRALSDKLDDLARRDPSHRAVSDLRQEIADLREAFDQSNVEGTLMSLERGYSHIVERLDDLKRQVTDGRGFSHLEDRLDELRERLGGREQVEMMTSLERRISALAGKVDLLAQSGDRDRLRDLEGQIADLKAVMLDADPRQAARGLDRLADKIEELRAIGLDTGRNDPRMDALERRIADLSEMIAHFDKGPGGAILNAFNRKIAEMNRKIETVERANPAGETLAVLDQAVRRIEELSNRQPDTERLGRVEKSVLALADHLERAAASRGRDAGEIDSLREEIVAMRREFAARPRADEFTQLEKEVRLLADKLDESAARGMDDRVLAQIEGQMNRLARQIADMPASNGGIDMGALIERLDAQLRETRADALEVARDAAFDAVREINAQARPNAIDEAAIAGLRDDLRRLQAASVSTETKTHETLGAVRDTLATIVNRLTQIERDGLQRAPAAAPSAAFAAAPMAPPQPAASQVASEEPVARAPAAPPRPAPHTATTMRPPQPAAAPRAPEPQVAVEPSTARDATPRVVETAPFVEKPVAARPAAEDHRPLEPGAGRPVPGAAPSPAAALMAQAAAAAAAAPVDPAARKADFIAAARRAAQAAAQAAAQEEDAKPANSLKDRLGAALKGNKGKDAPQPANPSVGRAPMADPSRLAAVEPMLPRATDGDADEPVAKRRFALPSLGRKPMIMAAAAVLLALAALQFIPSSAPPETQDARVEADLAADAPAATVDAANGETNTAEAVDAAPTTAAPATDTAAAPAATPTAPAAATAMPPAATPIATGANVPAPPASIGSPELVRAAAGGDPKAQYEIGTRYSDGRGVPQDLAEAVVWYQRAADAGLAPAQYRLGSYLEKGTGTAKDTDRARAYYELAAKGGNAKAMHNLGVLMTQSGKQDELKPALGWFERAAEHGVRDSQYNLGIMYARGFGVPVDLAAAYKWFSVAAVGGDADAGKKRDEVGKALDPASLSAAKMAAETFKPKTPDPAANEVANIWGDPPTAPETTSSISKPPVTYTASRGQMQEIQMALALKGFYSGTIDGVSGKATSEAVRAFQRATGQKPTGEMDQALFNQITGRAGKAGG